MERVQHVQMEPTTVQEMKATIVTFVESIPVVKITEHAVMESLVMEANAMNVQTELHTVAEILVVQPVILIVMCVNHVFIVI